MKIETELSIDDTIYYLEGGKIAKGIVEGLFTNLEVKKKLSISYNIRTKDNTLTTRPEENVGKSQEDLFNKIKLNETRKA